MNLIDSVSKKSGFESLMSKLAPSASDAMVSLTDSVVIDLSSHYKDSLSEIVRNLAGLYR